ncbi:MAG: RagB/SusD family nutrient uptake outer membrane protein [Salinivirgaceae bacterium]|jgi:tetratricopeptide (TPR) repeat protein|nr:RagB/SusD family nutrient uptake outer membrane protein [Salinivirgaceae bacterium]
MNKIKYFTRHIAISALVVSLFASCSDDFFEAEMGARITPDQHYKSYEDVDLSYLGCKAHLQDIAENHVLVDGLRSDQMDITEYADRDMIDINRHELTSDNKYFDPSNYYKMIININEMLPYLPQVLEIDRDFDSLAFEAYNGLLVTLRSWAYFNLVRLNGEVAIVDADDPSKAPEYLSKSQTLDRLISELLPFYSEEDIYRYDIDHYVLLGELYLEKGDYANAVKYLKYSIDGPAFAQTGSNIWYMVDNVFQEESWKNIFINSEDQNTTVRTKVRYSFVTGQGNTLEQWMHQSFKPDVKPTAILIDAFKNETQQNGDPADVYRGLGASYDTTASGDYFINKYSIDTELPHGADVILYRAADIHLLLAEALNRNGESALALALLNKGLGGMTDRPGEYSKWSANAGVRGRVYLADVTADGVEAIEDLIIAERAKELAFEGKRWFDLVRVAERRIKKGTGDESYLADKVASKFDDAETAKLVKDKLMDKENWYLPIPR